MAVIANFGGGETKVYTRELHQYDTSQKLIIQGLNLPEYYEVHFSNNKECGTSYSAKGIGNEVGIPDAYLATGEYIYAWIYFREDNVGETAYEIVIPVAKRPSPLPIGRSSIFGDDYEVEGENLIFK